MRNLLLMVILLSLCGCEKKNAEEVRKYADFAENDVLIRIEGNCFLKKMCEEDARLICILAKKTNSKNKEVLVTDRDRALACANFASKCAVQKLITAKGIKNLRAISDKQVSTLASKLKLAKKGVSESALRRRLEREIILTSYVNFVVSNDYPVTSNQIVNAQNRIKWSNEIAQATNSLVYVTASNVYSRIQMGDDFLELAKKYDEEPVHGGPGEWGRINESWYADDVEFLKILKETPEGGITPPIEADEGLLIVKVVSKKSAEENGQKQNVYDLQRIYFRLPIFYKEEGFEETRKNIHRAKCEKLAREIIDRVVKDVSVEYPNGKIKWELSGKEIRNENK